MDEIKIKIIIASFIILVFSIIGLFYIISNVVKYIRKEKIIRIKNKIELPGSRVDEIVPPSLFVINDTMIDLDSVISLSLTKDKGCIIFTYSTNSEDCCNYISMGDLNFIKDTDELKFNGEYKVITDEYLHQYYNEPSPETKMSKHEEIEKLYNQLLKWKGIRKLYLSSGEKATIYDYSFYSMIKNIKFIDIERNVRIKIHQIIYKIRNNSTYGISNLDNIPKENKNEKIIYVED